jgi:hypothetical protein
MTKMQLMVMVILVCAIQPIPIHFSWLVSVAPSSVKVEDIIEFDMSGKALNGDNRTAYGERFIHSGNSEELS